MPPRARAAPAPTVPGARVTELHVMEHAPRGRKRPGGEKNGVTVAATVLGMRRGPCE